MFNCIIEKKTLCYKEYNEKTLYKQTHVRKMKLKTKQKVSESAEERRFESIWYF